MRINPLVSVAVLTYNSESTIRQCIDLILMQKTSFDIENLRLLAPQDYDAVIEKTVWRLHADSRRQVDT